MTSTYVLNNKGLNLRRALLQKDYLSREWVLPFRKDTSKSGAPHQLETIKNE